MTDLRPCGHCARHVRALDSMCPFCGAALSASPLIVEPRRRLSRAAVFAAATLTATACWTNKTEPKHVESHAVVMPDAATAHVETVVAPPIDAAVVVAAPPDAAIVQQQQKPPPPPPFDPDDGQRRVQHHPCTMTPKGPICAPYGAPPARRRVV